MLSAEFLMMLTITCSNRLASTITSFRFSERRRVIEISRSWQMFSMNILQELTSVFKSCLRKSGSGIFTTSAKFVIKRLLLKHLSIHTRITSRISSVFSTSVKVDSTVSNVEVIPAVVLFTS